MSNPQINVELVPAIEMPVTIAGDARIDVDVAARGPKGDTGDAGADGADGADGVGVPVGGTTGQVLAKKSNTDHDTEWVAQSGGGAVDSVNAQTGVVVLDADDIDDTATTHKFVTSTDITKLSNLSGTNTGDQDLSSYATTAALAAKENIAKVTPIAVSTSTAAGTAAKVATTTGGTYTPATGDIILVTFTAANTATNPTINIDGSGAKSILLGDVNPTAVAMAGTKVMMWYDGTAFQLFGSQRVSDTDTNTTYPEISEAEITAGSASTARSITGRRSKFIIDTAVGNVAAATQTLTNKTISGSNNTLSDIAQASVTNLTSDLAGKASSTHTHAIDDLSDVTISAPSTGQVIKYNGSAWVNDTDATAGGAGSTNLSATLSASQTVIASDTGTDATIPAVDGTNAGVMTPTMKSKLDGIETAADVTDATNVDAAGAVMNSDTSTASMSFVVDEDNMASNSATKVPTQQSVKAYVDTEIAGVGGGTGDVVGPASSTADTFPIYSGTTGKLLTTTSMKYAQSMGWASFGTTGGSELRLETNNGANDLGITANGDPVVTTTATQTLTNKTISGSSNTVTDIVATTALTATGTKSSSTYLRGDNTWATPTNTTYSEITTAEIDAGTASTSRTITGRRVDYIQDKTLERAYPVGSIYISTVSTNPNTLFGFGTWAAYAAGRVVVGKASSGTFATAGATGGAETHTHQHMSPVGMASGDPYVINQLDGNLDSLGNYAFSSIVTADRRAVGAGAAAGVEMYAVTSSSSSSLQPYIVAYMWERTA